MIFYFSLAPLALYLQEEEVALILLEVGLQGHHLWYP